MQQDLRLADATSGSSAPWEPPERLWQLLCVPTETVVMGAMSKSSLYKYGKVPSTSTYRNDPLVTL